MGRIINIGVLGCSSFAKRSMLPTIKKLKDKFNLTGVASRNIETAIEFAQIFETKPHSYESLLEDCSIDAIYIPLPNSMHAEWIDKALDNGMHVLVEKSFATSLTDVIRLNNKARKNKLVAIENFQFRFHNQLTEIRNLIDTGTIGELRCMRSSFGFPPFPDDNNIRYQSELGGGALLDAGSYPLKITQIILGYDVEVKAAKLFYDDVRKIDTWGGGFIRQTDGPLFSEIAFGFDHFYQCNVELWGSKGKLTATRLFTAQPTFEPEIVLETSSGTQLLKTRTDDHFINMLVHFHKLINQPALAEDEYVQNINQSRLIDEFKNKSNE